MKPSGWEKLSPLDLVSALLSTPERPFDYALRLAFARDGAPTESQMIEGARRAVERFPASACVRKGARWESAASHAFRLDNARCDGPDDRRIESFIDEPLDLTREPGVRQLRIENPRAAQVDVVTRMHHALGDFVSLLLWLDAQLSANPALEHAELKLRHHAAPARRSRYAFDGPADPVKVARHGKPSARRRWKTLTFEPCEVEARPQPTFTYNDLLCAILLETLRAWNESSRVALWHAVNAREEPFSGFGNGSSRIRIYHRFEQAPTYAAKAAHVREQIVWCKENGEWAVPDDGRALFKLPLWALKPALLAFAYRPGVDYASMLFSHIGELAPRAAEPEFLSRVTDLECIAQLHARHPLAIVALGFRGKTRFTLTWDDALYSEGDIDRFLACFESHRAAATAELRGV